MIRVTCVSSDNKCQKAYTGCREQVMYSDADYQIICEDGRLTVTERELLQNENM